MSLIKNIQRDTRRFAKRQRTWWNNQPNTLGWTPLKKLSIFNKDFGMRANKLGQNLGSYDNCGAGEKTESSKLSPLSENLDLDTTLDPRKPRTVGRTKKNRQLELQQLKRDEERLFELSFVDGLEATSEIVKEFLSQDLSNCFQALKCENDSDGRSERVYYGKIALI